MAVSLGRRAMLGVAGTLALRGVAVPSTAADSPLATIRTIRILPRNESEVELAHARARSNSCERLPPDLPYEMNTFSLNIGSRERAPGTGLLDPATRRQILSVGLEVLREDQGRLPALSRSLILQYLAEHYVTIQARVQKDQRTGKLYLHHRPLAATMNFTGARLTQGFHEAVAQAIDDFRSLGLLVKPRTEPSPEAYRTLVLVHRNRLASTLPGASPGTPRTVHELVFIRARGTGAAADRPSSAPLTLHTFVTTNARKTLHHLEPAGLPRTLQDCAIRATVQFTSFETANLIPKDSLIRRFALRSRTSYPFAALDDYCRSQGWSGDACDNLTEVLDAILDGKLRG